MPLKWSQGEEIVSRIVVSLGIVLIAILLFAGGRWLYMRCGMRGFTARAEPSHMEVMMAEYARETDANGYEQPQKNIVSTAATQHEAKKYYAGHCTMRLPVQIEAQDEMEKALNFGSGYCRSSPSHGDPTDVVREVISLSAGNSRSVAVFSKAHC